MLHYATVPNAVRHAPATPNSILHDALVPSPPLCARARLPASIRLRLAYPFTSAWRIHSPPPGACIRLSLAHPFTSAWRMHSPQPGASIHLRLAHAFTSAWRMHSPQPGACIRLRLAHPFASAWRIHSPCWCAVRCGRPDLGRSRFCTGARTHAAERCEWRPAALALPSSRESQLGPRPPHPHVSMACIAFGRPPCSPVSSAAHR